MNKIIVEVGSTCTKIDMYNGKNIKKLENLVICPLLYGILIL